MLRKIARLFTIKTRWEACMVIFALALGAAERGQVYIVHYPGFGGKLLFLACMGSVVLAGAKLFDCLRYEAAERERAQIAAAGNDNAATYTQAPQDQTRQSSPEETRSDQANARKA